MIEELPSESALSDDPQRVMRVDHLNGPLVCALRGDRSVERLVKRLDDRIGEQIDPFDQAVALFPIPLRGQLRCARHIGELQRPVDRIEMGENLIEPWLAPEPLQFFPCLPARSSGKPGEFLFRGGHAEMKSRQNSAAGAWPGAKKVVETPLQRRQTSDPSRSFSTSALH
ncbi:MAG TPA: hypothetical protein VFX67_06175 [Burkholderiales bacterium]|nr:hypothetical protein [Burkholderiales bacterium]